MIDNKKIKIKNIDEFADLFLAVYSYDNHSEKDDIVYISRHFKKVINHIMNTSENYKELLDSIVYTSDGKFNIKSFMYRIKYSPLKHSYASNFTYDEEKDSLVTYISERKIEKEFDKYNNETISLIQDIVSMFSLICKGLEVADDVRVLNYVIGYTDSKANKSDD